jgi:hypothetical protein
MKKKIQLQHQCLPEAWKEKISSSNGPHHSDVVQLPHTKIEVAVQQLEDMTMQSNKKNNNLSLPVMIKAIAFLMIFQWH